MQRENRRLPAGLTLLVAVVLAGCGAMESPDSDPNSDPVPTPVASVAAAEAEAQRAAYGTALCPILTSIVALDPRLAELRELGSERGDVEAASGEMDALVDELLTVLDALEAVPTWAPGGELRFLLINTIHTIRSELVVVAQDPSAAGAAQRLEALPFMATPAMDRAMGEAGAAGLLCERAE